MLDHESIIQEEGGFDEGVKKNMIYQKVPAQEKAHLRDFDISHIHTSFSNGDQHAIIDYLRSYKISDLLFIRGAPNSQHSIYTYNHQDSTFTIELVNDTQFNILQLAILGDHFDLVKYILVEHKTFSNTKQPRTIDPAVILFNQHDESDDTLTLRLAIQNNSHEIFSLLWNQFPQIYTERHLLLAAKFCFAVPRYSFLEDLLNSETAHPIFLQASVESRTELVELFNQSNIEQIGHRGPNVRNILMNEPYTRLDRQVNDELNQQIYNDIRSNNFDHLQREIVEYYGIHGAAHLRFDFLEQDEEILHLSNGNRVYLS